MSTSGGGCGSLDKANRNAMFEYQAPATLNQAAPVQNTWYDILPETDHVKLYNIAVNVNTANETLECQVIIDGETIAAVAFAATLGTPYFAYLYPNPLTQTDTITLDTHVNAEGFGGVKDIEGHTVQVQLRKTTATGAGNLQGIVIYGVLNRT